MRNLKRTLSVVLASVMLLGMMVVGANAASFSDADEIVNKEAVEVTAGLGLFAGTDGKFLPKDNVTRAQMATIIVKMLYGSEINADQYKGIDKFSDTASFEGGWAEGYINLCANLGIVAGYGDGTYQPGKQVTTAEAVTMIINALGVDAGEGTWPLTVMAKAEEMKLFEELSPKPGTNEALIRDQLASIVLEGLEYSPSGNNGYKVRLGNKDITFEKFSDALLAAQSVGKTANDIEEIVGEDSLANKTFEMKTAKGIIFENQASASDAEWTTIGDTDYNIETGLDMLGHLVTVYYKDAYTSEKEPGTTYAIVDESKAVVVDEDLVAGDTTDTKTFKSQFGTKQLTAADTLWYFDPEYFYDDMDGADFVEYDFGNKAALAGTYIISENEIVAYLQPAQTIATTVTRVTTTAGKESITLTGIGQLNNNEDEDVVKEYEGIQKDDYVTAVKAGDTWTLTKLTEIEGKITRTYTKDGHAYLTVDGKTYQLFEGTNRIHNGLGLPTDFDPSYKIYLTAKGDVVEYIASEGQADLSNIVYVVKVFCVNSTDDYGNDTYKVSAQVVDMDGKTATYLLASYKTENGQVVPSEESNGKTSALPNGTMGVSFNKNAQGFLTGATQTGFYTFKKSTNSKLATLGIMEPTAVPAVYDKNDAPVYQATTQGMDNQEINSKTVSIRTTDGTAYLADTTKFIVYDGTGAALTATISTGKLYHTFDGEAGVILSRNANGNKVLEAVLINKDPEAVSNGEFYYADGHSFDFNTAAGAQHNLYNQKGEKVAVTLEKGLLGVAKGFYKYSVDSEGVVTLNDPESAQYAKVNQLFETVYNNMIVAGEITDYDISGAKLVDARDEDAIEDSETAAYVIEDINELVNFMNDDDAPEIYLDMYVDPDAKTVSLIFITQIIDPQI